MINKESVQEDPQQPARREMELFQKAEKEIYENITQCLCLAKMRMTSIELEKKEDAMARIGEASLLIGKAVKDLRNLAKQLALFYP